MNPHRDIGLDRLDGFDAGRDPRSMSSNELEQMGSCADVSAAGPAAEMPRLLQWPCAGGAFVDSAGLHQLAVPDGQEPVGQRSASRNREVCCAQIERRARDGRA